MSKVSRHLYNARYIMLDTLPYTPNTKSFNLSTLNNTYLEPIMSTKTFMYRGNAMEHLKNNLNAKDTDVNTIQHDYLTNSIVPNMDNLSNEVSYIQKKFLRYFNTHKKLEGKTYSVIYLGSVKVLDTDTIYSVYSLAINTMLEEGIAKRNLDEPEPIKHELEPDLSTHKLSSNEILHQETNRVNKSRGAKSSPDLVLGKVSTKDSQGNLITKYGATTKSVLAKLNYILNPYNIKSTHYARKANNPNSGLTINFTLFQSITTPYEGKYIELKELIPTPVYEEVMSILNLAITKYSTDVLIRSKNTLSKPSEFKINSSTEKTPLFINYAKKEFNDILKNNGLTVFIPAYININHTFNPDGSFKEVVLQKQDLKELMSDEDYDRTVTLLGYLDKNFLFIKRTPKNKITLNNSKGA